MYTKRSLEVCVCRGGGVVRGWGGGSEVNNDSSLSLIKNDLLWIADI